MSTFQIAQIGCLTMDSINRAVNVAGRRSAELLKKTSQEYSTHPRNKGWFSDGRLYFHLKWRRQYETPLYTPALCIWTFQNLILRNHGFIFSNLGKFMVRWRLLHHSPTALAHLKCRIQDLLGVPVSPPLSTQLHDSKPEYQRSQLYHCAQIFPMVRGIESHRSKTIK